MFVYYIPATKFHFHISKKKKKQEKKNTQQSFNHRTVTKSWEFLPQTTTTTKTIWLLCGFRGASRWFIRRLRCGDAGGGIRRSTAMNYSFMAEMMGLRHSLPVPIEHHEKKQMYLPFNVRVRFICVRAAVGDYLPACNGSPPTPKPITVMWTTMNMVWCSVVPVLGFGRHSTVSACTRTIHTPTVILPSIFAVS